MNFGFEIGVIGIICIFCANVILRILKIGIHSPRFDSFNEHGITPAMIHEAEQFLRIPTWSRSYKRCDHPDSEYSCKHLISAARVVLAYELKNTHNVFDDYVISGDKEGIANRNWADLMGLVYALVTNRNFAVMYHPTPGTNGNRNANLYPDYVRYLDELSVDLTRTPVGERCSCNIAFDIDHVKRGYSLDVFFTHPNAIYLNPSFSYAMYELFGRHAAYFLLNYLIRFPESTMKLAMELLESVPKTVQITAFHFRYHSTCRMIEKNSYIGSWKKAESAITPLVREWTKRPYVFAVASDNGDHIRKFRELCKSMTESNISYKILSFTDIPRGLNADHHTALLDMILLMYSNVIVGTLLSTFTASCAMRTANNPYYITYCLPYPIKFSFSQTNWMYQSYIKNGPFRAVDQYRLDGKTEPIIRLHMRHFGI